MSYRDVFDKVIDSFNATVGGGSASAIAGAMAAGLIGMVARLSTKKDYGLPSDRYLEIAKEADNLVIELLFGSEEDTQAFCLIKDAFALPKTTDEEKAKRNAAIEEAGIKAATVPKNNAYKCKQVFDLAMLLKGKSNSNAASDLEIGDSLCNVAILGCISNIEANLSLIKDERIRTEFKKDINFLKTYVHGKSSYTR